MKTITKNKYLLLALSIMLSNYLFAQENRKGLGSISNAPKVVITNLSDINSTGLYKSGNSEDNKGLVVFNTKENKDLGIVVGLYVWNGSRWNIILDDTDKYTQKESYTKKENFILKDNKWVKVDEDKFQIPEKTSIEVNEMTATPVTVTKKNGIYGDAFTRVVPNLSGNYVSDIAALKELFMMNGSPVSLNWNFSQENIPVDLPGVQWSNINGDWRVTELDIRGKGVALTNGIDKLYSLEKLDCSLNKISSLDLRKIKGLKVLDCSKNYMSQDALNDIKNSAWGNELCDWYNSDWIVLPQLLPKNNLEDVTIGKYPCP